MVYEERKKNKGSFINGVLVGIVCCGLVLTLVKPIVNYVEKKTGMQIANGQSSVLYTTELLDDETITKIGELSGYIDMYYYEDVDDADLKEGLYEGLVAGIGDDYSGYYDEEAYANLQVSTKKVYGGIGAGISTDKETELESISFIYEGSPAEAAGLEVGDIFAEVDGTDVTGMESSELVKLLRGDEGTTVHVKVYRESEGTYVEVDMVRAVIDIPTVYSEMLVDDIGYIQISDFGSATAESFKEAVDELNASGMQKMIIDIRGNTGGLVSAATEILDYILPEGVVVYTEDKYGNRKDYTSSGDTFMMCDICVLMNSYSASASEILAGALRDYNVATLIGTTTFGKGIVQTIYPLSDNDAIKLTTATYYTPNGDCIHGKGIDPDIELEYEYSGDTDADFDYTKDNQIMKAIEVFESESE
ncbi:MAG: S41 family peptidase [Lachnospiraceae bacterium]|nr:S41 family peptidase [Lachnospiraceae bacterium]